MRETNLQEAIMLAGLLGFVTMIFLLPPVTNLLFGAVVYLVCLLLANTIRLSPDSSG